MQPIKDPKGEPIGRESMRLEDGAVIRQGEDADGSSFTGRATMSPDGNTITDLVIFKSKDSKTMQVTECGASCGFWEKVRRSRLLCATIAGADSRGRGGLGAGRTDESPHPCSDGEELRQLRADDLRHASASLRIRGNWTDTDDGE